VSNSIRLANGGYRAVLFDLDGTLADTAPDMVRVLQDMQVAHGRTPVDYDAGRSTVSNGSLGLLRLGFPELDEDERKAIVPEFLERYAASLCEGTTLFPQLTDLLDDLDEARRPWGVVTNKPEFLTHPLLRALEIFDRSAAVVGGDTLPLRKPDPAPLLHACKIGGFAAAECVYVGDAARDIEAGRRAGMATIAAAYGYITDDDDPASWNADEIAADTGELTQIVLKAVNLGA